MQLQKACQTGTFRSKRHFWSEQKHWCCGTPSWIGLHFNAEVARPPEESCGQVSSWISDVDLLGGVRWWQVVVRELEIPKPGLLRPLKSGISSPHLLFMVATHSQEAATFWNVLISSFLFIGLCFCFVLFCGVTCNGKNGHQLVPTLSWVWGVTASSDSELN